MKLATIIGAAALVLVIGAAAVAQNTSMQGGHGMMNQADMQKMMGDMMPNDSDAASTKAFKQAHMKMMKEMHIKLTGKADVDFMRGMIPHHQGAIDMAKVELAHGSDATVRAMAQKIIDDQEREIAQMQEWLKKNDK